MARRVKRRETEIFSISFLDCITCGLGSVVLLLVLSNIRTPTTEESETEEHQRMTKLQDDLVDIEQQRIALNEQLAGRREQLSDVKERIARLQGDLSSRAMRSDRKSTRLN